MPMIRQATLNIPVLLLKITTNLVLIFLNGLMRISCFSFAFLPKLIYRFSSWRSKKIEGELIKDKMRNASSFQEWLRNAKIFDNLKGWTKWRKNRKSSYYDYKYIGRLEHLLKRYMDQDNFVELMALLRATTGRNVGGISNPKLFERAHSGTKELIHSYQQRVSLFFSKKGG